MALTKYVVLCTLKRGVLLPPEPVDEKTRAELEYRDRLEEMRRLERVHWNPKYNPVPRRRREVA